MMMMVIWIICLFVEIACVGRVTNKVETDNG